MHPDLIREYITTWQQEKQKERLETLATRGEQERRLVKVRRDIENIVTAITEGMFHPSMKAKMDGLEVERAELEAKLASLPELERVAIHRKRRPRPIDFALARRRNGMTRRAACSSSGTTRRGPYASRPCWA
jgi:hypothetical protein